MMETLSPLEILRWHVDMGADETIGEQTVDRFALIDSPAPDAAAAKPAPVSPRGAPAQAGAAVYPGPGPSEEMVKSAREIASQASDVDALHKALLAFDGCGLKKTATNLVFVDGDPAARLMLVGEAPGAQEDRQGLPFVGPSGELLNKMLASIGLARSAVLISNTVFWRPPGNRTPTRQESAICLPFMERLIELVAPDILVTLGGPATKALLGQSQGVGRLRGRWFAYQPHSATNPIDATVLIHPDYLLLTPTQKRATWQDLLMIKEKLSLAAKAAD